MASREMTVAEMLDREIHNLLLRVKGPQELRDNLGSAYLNRGCSSIAAIFSK
jgi:hypothetical protein